MLTRYTAPYPALRPCQKPAAFKSGSPQPAPRVVCAPRSTRPGKKAATRRLRRKIPPPLRSAVDEPHGHGISRHSDHFAKAPPCKSTSQLARLGGVSCKQPRPKPRNSRDPCLFDVQTSEKPNDELAKPINRLQHQLRLMAKLLHAVHEMNVPVFSLSVSHWNRQLAIPPKWLQDFTVHKRKPQFVPDPGYSFTSLYAVVPEILARESDVQAVAFQPDLTECNALRAACQLTLVWDSIFNHVEHMWVASCVVGGAQEPRAREPCKCM